MANSRRVVQMQNRFESRQAGRDHFGSAAEAGKEVGFDETGRDLEVRFDPFTVQKYGHAAFRVASVNQRCVIARIVTNNAALPRNIAAEHFLEFNFCVEAVRARRDKNRDLTQGEPGHL